VTGPTGVGKSTLFDILPWILFGKTAKDGAANEVLSWKSKGMTYGRATIDINGKSGVILRTRNPNDLYYQMEKEEPVRGKDLLDTQKKINELIGMDSDAFLSSYYLHEFSQATNFFTASAKERRRLTEDMTDLSLPIRLTERAARYKKLLQEEETQWMEDVTGSKTQIYLLEKMVKKEKIAKDDWDEKQIKKIEELKSASKNFEKIRKNKIKEAEEKVEDWNTKKNLRIDSLNREIKDLEKEGHEIGYKAKIKEIEDQIAIFASDKCPECGSAKHSNKILVLTKDKNNLLNKENETKRHRLNASFLIRQLEREVATENPFLPEISSAMLFSNNYKTLLKSAQKETNPHQLNLEEFYNQIKEEDKKSSETEAHLIDLRMEIRDVELLLEILVKFRSSLVLSVIQELEIRTNEYLSECFDAEIKVEFLSEEADKIQVKVSKDGNSCSFTQLSRGQRQLLKFCFGVSVMEVVINRYGVGKQYLFFDECLTGLDEGLKVKALKLLNLLSTTYNSVYVIEHSPKLKEQIPNQIVIAMDDGESQLCQP
jgi:DNA repair exonuclease SbcCD ATPase subunit